MRRGLIIAAGWVGAVAAATAFGVAAISAVGSGDGPGAPLSQQDVSDRLAQAAATPHGGPTSSAKPTPGVSTSATATATRQYFTTSGGGVWASCVEGKARLDTMTPRQGFRLDGYDTGPASAAWVRFKLDVQHGHANEYQVTITCPNGIPTSVETSDS
jgi:hypothetical protein